MSFTPGAGTRFLAFSTTNPSSGSTTLPGPLSITGGTATTNTPVLSATQTWNNAAVTFTGWQLNVTDTASNAASLLMDLQVGGVSRVSVNKFGNVTINSNANPSVGYSFGGAGAFVTLYKVGSGGAIAFTGGANTYFDQDAISIGSNAVIARDAANALAQRNGVNWQSFRIYSTYTDASNYERLEISQSGAGWYIGNGALGTGPGNRQITILAFGQLVFGSNGGAKWLINTTGHLLANTDNSFDIGASGANRPRNLFLAGNITTGGGLTLAAAGYLTWPGRGSFDAAAVDIVRLSGATVGAALQMSEMTAPAAPAANEVRIYAEDNGSGKTRLMALFATGAAQQIAIEP